MFKNMSWLTILSGSTLKWAISFLLVSSVGWGLRNPYTVNKWIEPAYRAIVELWATGADQDLSEQMRTLEKLGEQLNMIKATPLPSGSKELADEAQRALRQQAEKLRDQVVAIKTMFVEARKRDLAKIDAERLATLIRVLEAECARILAMGSPPPPPPAPPSEPAAAAAETLFELLRAKNVAKLKERFLPNLRAQVTCDSVAAAHEQHAAAQKKGMSIQVSQGAEPLTWEVTRNGVRLTTLVAQDGRWLADTVWFGN